MAIGKAQNQQRFDNPRDILGDRLKPGSIYRLLADEGHRLFPDEYFADCYMRTAKGRPTIPARVLATTMLLQSFEGLSDREAADRLEVDLRWQAAAGLDVGSEAFHPTVLVGMRNRLRCSSSPRRLFEDTKVMAKATGALSNRARVLDSTPLYDAVATQDTVTQLRAAIRKVLTVLGDDLESGVRDVLARDDDYSTPGKPPCDWDDPAAREALVDELVKDGLACLDALDGKALDPIAQEATELLALVCGQDVEGGDDRVFRIVRKVAKDRVISTVDVEARHGHKSRNRSFDGYKTHVAVDPDSEIVTDVAVTPGNAPDRDVVDELLVDDDDEITVIGDSAYADGATLARLQEQGHEVMAKVPPAHNTKGGFTKDDFVMDTTNNTVTCPAGHVVDIRPAGAAGRASFKPHCSGCPLREQCTSAKSGRSVSVHVYEDVLQRAKAAQRDEEWKQRYRADRPKVERKIAHFVRKPWGGRRARSRGLRRVTTDVLARAGVINLARLAGMGLHWSSGGWAIN